MKEPLSPKQFEFIINSKAKWNLAHGSVRTGKTVGTTFAFMHKVDRCPDSKIYIVGHTFDTAYRNVVRLLMESTELAIFRPFCTWSGKKLLYKDKVISVLGAKDEGAIGNFQGLTMSLCYCDEMTLYPESIVDMIDTRLSEPWSQGFAAMNPSHPNHKIKKWIDMAEEGNKDYYALHFTLEDNPYLEQSYKDRLKNSLSGIFYKRNYLGLWCLAEGSIFDFFDPKIHVVPKPPAAAEYWIAAIDYGAVNPFACLLIGVSTGRHNQTSKKLWVEKEYYWDPAKRERQKTNSEFADDVQVFLQDYDVKQLYIDPSAAAFKTELRRRGLHPVDANNEVLDGITMMTTEMKRGTLSICSECTNTIREVESYVWDSKAAEKGWDEPLKKNDHAVDALRYAIATHKVSTYDPYKRENQGSNQIYNVDTHEMARDPFRGMQKTHFR
jgi:PBSX family phage terminase large subunit